MKIGTWKKIALPSKWQNSSKELSGWPKINICLVTPLSSFDGHTNELFELFSQELTQFWLDVSLVAKVLYNLYQPTKVNYLVFGHHCPHVHCHPLVHSYKDDPSKPVDMNEKTVLLSPQQYQHVIAQMRSKLQETT